MVQSARTLALTEAGAGVNVPPTILRCNLTMNAAYALCVDDIFGGATAYAAAYEPAGVLPAAQRLFALYQAVGVAPDADLDLVDAWAADLGLTGWYAWQVDDTVTPPLRTPDPVRHRLPPPVRAKLEGGATNPDYFDDPGTQMAASLYMLDALRLFAQMERSAILEVAKEIATIGMNICQTVVGCATNCKEADTVCRCLDNQSTMVVNTGRMPVPSNCLGVLRHSTLSIESPWCAP